MTKPQENNTFIYAVIGLVVVIVFGLYFVRNRAKPTPPGADQLAQCLSDKGVKFYGASWCSHCKSQKELFGGAASKLPYVECALGNGVTDVCKQAKIESYPTWVDAAGKRETGTLTFGQLAEFSGCKVE